MGNNQLNTLLGIEECFLGLDSDPGLDSYILTKMVFLHGCLFTDAGHVKMMRKHTVFETALWCYNAKFTN